MLANANPFSGAVPANPFAREVAAVCGKHAAAIGSPGRLADFLRALQRNKHLAMDFWSLVVRISEEETSGSVDPDWLLAVIVEGVTGRSLASLEAPADKRSLGALASMLAGNDLDSRLLELDSLLLEIDPLPQHDTPLEYTPPPQLDQNRRLVLTPEPPAAAPAASALQPLNDDSLAPFRMAGYSDASPEVSVMRAWMVGLLLIAVGAAGLLLIFRHDPAAWTRLRTSFQAQYTTAMSSFNSPHRESHPAVAANPKPAPSTAGPFAVQDPTVPVEDPALAPPTAPAAAPQKPTPVAAGNPSPAAAEPLATDDPNLLAVPGQTMKLQLISSRVPIYPFTADGPSRVVVKAIITSRGTVRPIAVIAGDPDLQQAALDAVITWRYRPWLVDGVPTDVSTTITIDPPGSDAP